jgi:DNA-binding XRE family transcriptional regulator
MDGNELKRFRTAHALTQFELAQMLDVPEETVMAWEAPPHSQRSLAVSAPMRQLILLQLARHRYRNRVVRPAQAASLQTLHTRVQA